MKFDVFFSAHVLEHVPSVADVLTLAGNVLVNKGLFVAFTPNGSDVYRRLHKKSWNKLWGLVHPNFLDDQFYNNVHSNVLLASSPYEFERLSNTNFEAPIHPHSLGGYELLAAFRSQ